MNQTETPHIEMPFSIAEARQKLVINHLEQNIRIEKPPAVSINNYLKTQEEIEAEFKSDIYNNRVFFTDHSDIFDVYGRIVKNRSDNAYGSDNNPSGFMEENY